MSRREVDSFPAVAARGIYLFALAERSCGVRFRRHDPGNDAQRFYGCNVDPQVTIPAYSGGGTSLKLVWHNTPRMVLINSSSLSLLTQ